MAPVTPFRPHHSGFAMSGRPDLEQLRLTADLAKLDLIIGEGPSARSVRIDLAPFTLVGATTRAGLLATPLRDRFGIRLRLEFYTAEELKRVLKGAAAKLGAPLTEEGAAEIAARSRGTPRIAGRLLRRVRDENPGALIVWKPHPDVEAGLRPGAVAPADLAGLSDVTATAV